MKLRLALALSFCFWAAAAPTFAQRPTPPDLKVLSIRYATNTGSIDVIISNVGGKIAPPCQLHLKVRQNAVVTKEVIQNIPSIEKGGAPHIVNFSTAGWVDIANAATTFEATVNSDKVVAETNWTNNSLRTRANEKGTKGDSPFVPGAGLPDYSVAGVTVIDEQTALKVNLVNKGKNDSWGGELIVYALPTHVKKTNWVLDKKTVVMDLQITSGNAKDNLEWAWVTIKQKFKPLGVGATEDLLVKLPTSHSGPYKPQNNADGSGVAGTTITSSPLTFEASVYYIVITFPVGSGENQSTLGDNSYFFDPPFVESKVK